MILVLAGALRLYRPDLAYFNIHVERDLYRALQLLRLEEVPLLGSEMQYGGRVFGPLIYFIYALPLAFSLSPVGIGVFIGVFNTFVIGAAWWVARRYVGRTAALVAAGLYAFFPLEVIQLRYLWNPCFLPAMVLGMYGCFLAYLCGRGRWWLVGTALFFVAGFQLHFSVLMTLPALVIPAVLARVFPGWKVAAACAVVIVLSFSPMIVHELRAERANLSQVIEAPEIRKSFLERHRPNPNAWRNLVPIVTIDWWEDPYRLGFTYMYFTRQRVDARLGEPLAALLAGALTVAGAALFLLWLGGVATAGRCVWRGGRAGIRGADHAPRIMLLLLLWQFTPVFFLTFMNFHTPVAGEENSIVPIRYYLVTFPAGFFLAGLGFTTLLMAGRRLSPRRRALLVGVPAAAIFLASNFISFAYFAVMDRTGTALPYLYHRAPSLAAMNEVRDFLLDDLAITHDDYYTQVSTQNVFRAFAGESSIDYLITQDGRAMTNPGLPPMRHILIHGEVFPALAGMDPIPEEIKAPRLPEEVAASGAQLTPIHRLHHITIFSIDLADEEHHALFDRDSKRNFYYIDRPMRHLGPARR